MKPVSAGAILFGAVLASTSVYAGNCATDDAKAEAVVVFLEEHYGPAFMAVHPPDVKTGLKDVYFHPYQPQERDCEGTVRVANDCRITDAEGTPLDDATRERVFRCKLPSG